MCTLEDINQKVRKLCELRGFKDYEEVISNCWQIINRYLSFEGSSLDVVDYYLQNSLDNFTFSPISVNIKFQLKQIQKDILS